MQRDGHHRARAADMLGEEKDNQEKGKQRGKQQNRTDQKARALAERERRRQRQRQTHSLHCIHCLLHLAVRLDVNHQGLQDLEPKLVHLVRQLLPDSVSNRVFIGEHFVQVHLLGDVGSNHPNQTKPNQKARLA